MPSRLSLSTPGFGERFDPLKPQHNTLAFCKLLADIRDNEVVVARAASCKWMERISRKVCTEVGSIAATCKAPSSGREVKVWGILYTVT